MSSADGSRSPDDARSEGSFSIRKSSPDLLRHVMEETLARGESGMTAEEWQAVQEVARANSTIDLDMHQVTELLVASLLAARFPDLARPETSQRMCQHIASSLCGDPTSMQRLKMFWHQLRESIS